MDRSLTYHILEILPQSRATEAIIRSSSFAFDVNLSISLDACLGHYGDSGILKLNGLFHQRVCYNSEVISTSKTLFDNALFLFSEW